MKPEGVGVMIDDLGDSDPGEFFVQLGMLILESRQPFESMKGRQDGAHCPKDVGVWSGHVCGSTTPQCTKANQILKQMQTLWRNHVPLCIEVLILPNCPHGQLRSTSTDVTPPYEDDGYVLLEQWTIQAVQKKPNEVVVSPKNLFQALKSYLHFSQLSSWLSSTHGMRPSCIGYRVSPPAEFCTTTFTQDPQLHVFPVANINKSTNYKVWLAYLSRTPEIPKPICYELSPTGQPCSSNLHATQNKKRMSRSKSPRPRFEAVFQNITGSPKLISKSCSSAQSRPLIPTQQFQLASILEIPPLRSTYELSEDFLSNSSLSSDSKDDAYGVGFVDFKSRCDVKVGHVVNISCNKNLKMSMLTAGMRDLKFASTELVTGLPTRRSDWSSQTFDGLHGEFYESEEPTIGNYNPSQEVNTSIPRKVKSKYYELPSNNILQSNTTESTRTNRSSPINIVTKDGKLNYVQMLLKDQYLTDSDNSCSPDIDYLLSETLVKRKEPMNPEEMYGYLSMLCKKRNLRSKNCDGRLLEPTKSNLFDVRNDLVINDVDNDEAEIDEVYLKEFRVKKKFLKTDANLKCKNSAVCDHENPSKSIDVCDNFVDRTKSKNSSPVPTISNKDSTEGCNKKDLCFSETLEILESPKDQKSIKRSRKEVDSTSEQDTSNSKLSYDEAFHTQVERSHKTQEIEHQFNQIEKSSAANSLRLYLQSNKQAPVDVQNSSCRLPPSSLTLSDAPPHFHGNHIETTPSLKPYSAVPRRLQSKTPQESKHPSLIFMKSTQQNIVEEAHPKACKSDKESPESVVSSGNGCQVEVTPRIPTAADREGFRARVHHSSSMVFNSKTKLPMQSSPVPAKRLSAGCFDYDSSLSSVQAIKNSLSCNNLDDAGNSSDGCNRLRQAFSSSAPASTNCLLGNFEESLINGRIQPAGVIDGFTAEIGASGSFCPCHLTLPCLAFFFSLSEDSAPSPYLGHVNLESHSKRGYKVPNKGTVQVTLFNPNKSVLKIFVVTYDVSDMPPNHQTLLRQKTVYMPTPGSPSDNPGAPVYLRYLIHLRFASSKQCKIYLHTDIRLIFARDRFELDNRIYHYELRSFTETPQNPKYSQKK